jgi:tetratricopeptide (TPR) repeat protein
MGEAVNALGDTTQAITAFRKAIALSDEPTSAMREAYYGLLTAMDAEPNLRAQQMAVCAEALERFPTDAQLLCAMGGYLQAQGKLDMAARAYESAYRHGQIDPWTWHVTGIDEIAVSCLSLIRQLQNQDSTAQEVLEEAVVKLPQANRIRRQLIELYIKHNRRQEALSQLDKLHGEIPHREAFRSAVRGACLAAQQNWAAALGYLRTAYAAECRDVICLRWLTVTMIAMRDLDHARPVLLEWQAAEPASAEVQQYLSLYGAPANGGAVNSARTGVEFIDLSEDDGRSLRVDDGSAAGETMAGKPNFAQGPVRTIHEHGSRQR